MTRADFGKWNGLCQADEHGFFASQTVLAGGLIWVAHKKINNLFFLGKGLDYLDLPWNTLIYLDCPSEPSPIFEFPKKYPPGGEGVCKWL
jgi:hypothetical protein